MRERQLPPGLLLEKEFQSKLHFALVISCGDLAERGRAILKITVRVGKIRMIENVEEFGPELHVTRFRERDLLVHREIPILQAWSAADGALRSIVKLAERWIGKVTRAKPKVAIRFWIQLREWRHQAGCFCADKKIAIDQLVIVGGGQANRESALKLCDPRNCPVIQNLACQALMLRQWQLPVIADHKALRRVEQGQRAVGIEVVWIESLFEG